MPRTTSGLPRPVPPSAPRSPRRDLAAWGLGLAVALMVLAMVVPAVTGWNVHVKNFPPLRADWDPRVGVGTVPAVLLAVLGTLYAARAADSLAWRRLLLAAFVVSLAWMLSLALVDGSAGVGANLDTPNEYMNTARLTTDLGATLQEYVSKISFDAAPDNWPVHLAGHPAGALVFFVVLVRVGLDTGLEAGLAVTVVAATTAPAVLVLLRTLGAEGAARRAAPFLVLAPAAIWQCVTADGMFAAVAAWGLVALGLAGVRRGAASVGWAVLAGLLLGYAVMLSYGLPLLGVIALVVLWTAGSWRPLPVAALAAVAVVGVFALAGFKYWEAWPEIHERYWAGAASVRIPQYWMWGDLAALLFSAGPLAGAGLGMLVTRYHDGLPGRSARAGTPGESGEPDEPGEPGGAGTALAVRDRLVAVRLAAAGWAMVLLADLSQMSRAEVERIWLPFVPWLLVACALLPERWRRRGLVVQVVLALVVQHLLFTGW